MLIESAVKLGELRGEIFGGVVRCACARDKAFAREDKCRHDGKQYCEEYAHREYSDRYFLLHLTISAFLFDIVRRTGGAVCLRPPFFSFIRLHV